MATETDKVNTGALATIVAVGTFATLSIALGVDALVRYETNLIAAERASHASERYQKVVATQNGKLTTPDWVDQSKGVVSIPIERAKSTVLADLARDPSSASPVPPASAAPADTAPSGELGAAPAPSGSALAAATPAAPTSATAAPASSVAAAPAKAPAGAVSPKASTVLAVPAAPPAAPRPAPAPAAPAPSDG
jgi:hypothetical protein